MINAFYPKQLSLESYAQEALAGTWMELADGPDPFPDFLQDPSLWDSPDLHSDDDECPECGGPPPPFFNIPPPPPPPVIEDEDLETAHLIYVGGDKDPPGGQRKSARTSSGSERKIKHDWGQSDPPRKDCDESQLPQDVCPAFLISGDPHVRPRLQPPIAAVIVAATTFAFVITVAAIVCWRYRRHKNRLGSSKSSGDLANGVIYEDLPSGPAPRGLTPHGHDTRTLAPMELLDLKLANQLHNASFGGSEAMQRNLLNQYTTSSVISPSNVLYPKFPNPPFSQESAQPTKEFNIYENSQKTMYRDFPFRQPTCDEHFSTFTGPDGQKIVTTNGGDFVYATDYHNPFNRPGSDSPQVLSADLYSPDSQKVTNSDILYSSENSPRELDSENSRNSFLTRYQDLLTESNPPKKNSFKGSQDIYNPTYEEISTGSESTSVTSGSTAGRGSVAPSPQGREGSLLLQEGPWGAPCPCSGDRRGPFSKKSSRGRRHKTLFEEGDYHEGLVEPLAPPPIPVPALYTIPGTSDGRTSTSSSSDLPPDRGSRDGPRYYVGSPKEECRPYVTSHPFQPNTFGPQKNSLPPLPSRSDRYRIFFTTDRRRNPSGVQDSKTLDFASRKRNREKDKQSSVESEPLYHEL